MALMVVGYLAKGDQKKWLVISGGGPLSECLMRLDSVTTSQFHSSETLIPQ